MRSDFLLGIASNDASNVQNTRKTPEDKLAYRIRKRVLLPVHSMKRSWVGTMCLRQRDATNEGPLRTTSSDGVTDEGGRGKEKKRLEAPESF
jgi:hypothetical protein